MYIILSILLVLAILYIVCVNTLDKWRFRADRQYPYVRELMDEWEQVTRRLLDAAGGAGPGRPRGRAEASRGRRGRR